MRPAKQGAQELLPCRILGIIIDIFQLARGGKKLWGKTAGAAAWQEKVFAVLFSVGGACVLFTCAFLKQGAGHAQLKEPRQT